MASRLARLLLNFKFDYLAGPILLVILLIFFYEAFLPGNVLSPSALVFRTPFFESQASQDLFELTNPLISDVVNQFIPWRFYSWTSIRNGTLPLWNPYSYCGTPFIATMQSAVFYPINLILNLFPFESIFVISAVIRLWIAGIFTFMLCRLYKLGFIASMISAVSFMLCGYMISWLGFPHSNVSAWLPAVIFFSEKAILSSSKKDQITNVVFLAIVTGVQFLGGHIETSVDIVVTVGIYYLIRVSQLYRNTGWKEVVCALVSRGTVPLIIGIGIAAIQLIPFFEWLPLSNQFAVRSATQFHFFDPNTGFHLLSLPLLIFPNLYNNPSWGGFYWPFLAGWSNFNEMAIYIGLLPFFFSIIAIKQCFKEKKQISVAWFVILVISFGRSFHIPPFDWLNYLPGLVLEIPDRLRLITSFSLSLLAGIGFHATFLSREAAFSPLISLKKFSLLTIYTGFLILLTCNFILIPAAAKHLPVQNESHVYTDNTQRTSETAVTSNLSGQKLYEDMVTDLIDAFKPTNFNMYSPIFVSMLFVAGFVLYKKQKINDIFLKIFIFCVIAIDLIIYGQGYNPVIKHDDFYPRSAVVDMLARDKGLYRILGVDFVYDPDVHLLYNFQEVSGLDFPTKWTIDYFNLSGMRIPWVSYSIVLKSANSPLLRVLNIKYVVTKDPSGLVADAKKTNINNVWIEESSGVIPRAWIPERIVVTSDSEIRKALSSISDQRVTKEIYLDEREVELDSKTIDPASSNVELIEYSSQNAKWRIQQSQDSMLFISDSYYPGWKAYIDGVETKIYRANIAFRAVEVPKGIHLVEFRYRPLSFTVGVASSIFSILFLIIIFLSRNNK